MEAVFNHEPTSFGKILEIREVLPHYIKSKRLAHTLSVEYEATRLAKILFPELGIDEKYISDVCAAALLHDITKYYSPEEHMAICKEMGLSICTDSPIVHSITGAFVARRDFAINDIVYSAIYYHTTGKENMNIFEKITFIADYIEKLRTAEPCIEARNYFYNNIVAQADKIKVLDKTILMSLDSTLKYLLETEKAIDIETLKARNFLLAEYTLPKSVQE